MSSCLTELVRFSQSQTDTSKRHSRIYSKLILYILGKWKVDYNTASIQAKQTVYIWTRSKILLKTTCTFGCAYSRSLGRDQATGD